MKKKVATLEIETELTNDELNDKLVECLTDGGVDLTQVMVMTIQEPKEGDDEEG